VGLTHANHGSTFFDLLETTGLDCGEPQCASSQFSLFYPVFCMLICILQGSQAARCRCRSVPNPTATDASHISEQIRFIMLSTFLARKENLVDIASSFRNSRARELPRMCETGEKLRHVVARD
jgi:hypothetical protein